MAILNETETLERNQISLKQKISRACIPFALHFRCVLYLMLQSRCMYMYLRCFASFILFLRLLSLLAHCLQIMRFRFALERRMIYGLTLGCASAEELAAERLSDIYMDGRRLALLQDRHLLTLGSV